MSLATSFWLNNILWEKPLLLLFKETSSAVTWWNSNKFSKWLSVAIESNRTVSNRRCISNSTSKSNQIQCKIQKLKLSNKFRFWNTFIPHQRNHQLIFNHQHNEFLVFLVVEFISKEYFINWNIHLSFILLPNCSHVFKQACLNQNASSCSINRIWCWSKKLLVQIN